MALFYRINFTSKWQAGIWKIWVLALCFLVFLVAGAAVYMAHLYEEYSRPVLQPRLTQYQTLVDHAVEIQTVWQKAASAYKEVRQYHESQLQTPPCAMLGALGGVATNSLGVSSTGEPYEFRPESLSVLRGKGISLTGVVPLPTTDRGEHCQVLGSKMLKLVKDAIASGNCGHTNAVCSLNWSKVTFSPDDKELKATLHVVFADGKLKRFPEPFPELALAIKKADVFRERMRKSVLTVSSGKTKGKRDCGVWLDDLVLNCKRLLGSDYERVSAFAKSAVDPLAVTSEIAKYCKEKTPGEVRQFEESWKELSHRHWRRERALDCEELDQDVREQKRVAAGLPYMSDLVLSLNKVDSIYKASTNAVTKKTINEPTFWDRVIDPCISNATGKVISPKHDKDKKIEIDRNAVLLAFPLWEASFGDNKDSVAEEAPTVTLDDLRMILNNVETNSAGTWVTAVKAQFDCKVDEPLKRWQLIRFVQIDGRVPCGLQETGDLLPKP